MAVVTPGMPGELAGRLGNVIYYTVNGQLRARKKPGSVKNPRTPKQTAQRMRVKGIGALFRSLDIPLRCVWNRLAEGLPKSGYNVFMNRNIHSLNEEGQIANPAQFLVTDGGRRTPEWVKGEWMEDGRMAITWDTTAGEEINSRKDRLVIVTQGYYAPFWMVMTLVAEETAAERHTGQYVWTPTDKMKEAQVYGFFKNFDGEASKSFYLGELKMKD